MNIWLPSYLLLSLCGKYWREREREREREWRGGGCRESERKTEWVMEKVRNMVLTTPLPKTGRQIAAKHPNFTMRSVASAVGPFSNWPKFEVRFHVRGRTVNWRGGGCSDGTGKRVNTTNSIKSAQSLNLRDLRPCDLVWHEVWQIWDQV